MAHPTRVNRKCVALRRGDTVQFGNQRCCKASVLVTRRVCRTRLSCSPPQPPADHLSPVKGEFEGRYGRLLKLNTLSFHHLEHVLVGAAQESCAGWLTVVKLEG